MRFKGLETSSAATGQTVMLLTTDSVAGMPFLAAVLKSSLRYHGVQNCSGTLPEPRDASPDTNQPES
jgi:hypothetical protein